MRKIKSLIESSIDFPSEDLPLDIWQKEEDSYILKPELKTKILEALSQFPHYNLLKIAKEIFIVGSIGTDLYDKDADIDIHIHPTDGIIEKAKVMTDDDKLRMQKEVMDWFKNERDVNDWYVNMHPFEIYLQLDPHQDLLSDTVYDLLNDKWVKPFKKYGLEYNPYEVYQNVFSELKKVVGPADLDIGDLRRDVIDYKRLQEALKKLNKTQKLKIREFMTRKLVNIEDDIEDLTKNKEIWRSIRRRHSISSTDVIKDIEELTNSTEWKNDNFLFKLLDRYQYFILVASLDKLTKDDRELTGSDIPEIEKLLNNFMCGKLK